MDWEKLLDMLSGKVSDWDDNDITIPFPIRTLDFGIKGGEPLANILPRTRVPHRDDGERSDQPEPLTA
jgi:hypothetical protein